jgi:aminomethyltransferase
MSANPLLKTPLHALHLELGAKMVPFAGHDMPVAYRAGILAEHRHCRAAAALFDVSHMGQLRVSGDDAAHALEALVPADIVDLPMHAQRYACFTNPNGGILDDLMIARRADHLHLVVNAANHAADLNHLLLEIGDRCVIRPLEAQALLALQGPQAAAVLGRLAPEIVALPFMRGLETTLDGAACWVTRSGYTGEDGFEISVAAERAEALARTLLAQPEVEPAGLGARDTLRLEAGLCLHGHDIGPTTTPIEAALAWSIPKVRRPGGARAGRYPGAAVIEAQLAGALVCKRAGLYGLERVPVREATTIVDAGGRRLGHVTSGTIGPTVNRPIAMAYLTIEHAVVGHEVYAEVRGSRQPMRVCAMPFVPHRYFRR